MRKGPIVVLMVAASFAGGAAINGPGLIWARERLHDYLAEVLGSPKIQASSDSLANEDNATEALPTAPLPDLSLETLTGRSNSSPAREAESTADPSAVAETSPPASLPDSVRERAQRAPSPTPTSPPKADAALVRASAPVAGASADPEDTWAALRQRMKELKIQQYWIEGRPEGPVKFRCVVPLIAAGAVAQHFEAEGADEFQAAQAALRRLTLWRASEDP